MVIKKKIIWKSGEFGPFFSIENPLYRLKSYSSNQNFAKKKHTTCRIYFKVQFNTQNVGVS
jgi:hypothetical protein